MVTEFGKLADPIADKALIGAALIGLSMLGDLPWWVTVVILVREIGVTVLRFAVLRRGVIPASRGGKLKTLVQAVAIGLVHAAAAGAVADRRVGDHVGRGRADRGHRRRLRRLGDQGLPWTTRWSVMPPAAWWPTWRCAGQSVATAESLTAGLLAATLAGVPGASAVLRGGLVTYSEDTKIALAGVAPQILEAVGPVAAPTARALAVGARQRCAATWGVGLTGVAGPEPHGGHPVGTVFLGLAGPPETGIAEVVELASVRHTLGHPSWRQCGEAIVALRALVDL